MKTVEGISVMEYNLPSNMYGHRCFLCNKLKLQGWSIQVQFQEGGKGGSAVDYGCIDCLGTTAGVAAESVNEHINEML